MKAPWRESSGVMTWLFFCLVFLSICLILKEKWVAISEFTKNNKDVIDSISKAITALVLIIASIVSYFKFIRGRTLKSKLDIILDVTIVENRDGFNYHFVSIKIKNNGSVAIWNYVIYLDAFYDSDMDGHESIEKFYPHHDQQSSEMLIDVGETSNEHTCIKICKNISAVTYYAKVKDEHGTIWESYKSCKNATSFG